MLAAAHPAYGDDLVHVYLLHLSLLVPPSHVAAVAGSVVPLQGWNGPGLRRVGRELVRNPVLQGAAYRVGISMARAWLLTPRHRPPGLDVVGRAIDDW